jgi:hypothetical protein
MESSHPICTTPYCRLIWSKARQARTVNAQRASAAIALLRRVEEMAAELEAEGAAVRAAIGVKKGANAKARASSASTCSSR